MEYPATNNNVIKSLINHIDFTLNESQAEGNTLSNVDSYNELLNLEPAAFEEVCYNSSGSMSPSKDQENVSDISVCDILADFIRDLNDSDVNCIISEHENSSMKLSNISSTEDKNSLSDVSEIFSDNKSDCPPRLQPCSIISGSPFHLFNVKNLEESTIFTHNFPFTKRSAAYYGKYPYSYGNTYHPPKPLSDNDYLLKILSYIEIVMPGVRYNSAMVHKYSDGEAFMPHHCDDEECIEENSEIVTISLGESRFVEFKNTVTNSKLCHKLDHGNVFVMQKSTQGLFTHSIPKDDASKKTRLSVTLRLISSEVNKPPTECLLPPEINVPYSDLSSDVSLDSTNKESQDALEGTTSVGYCINPVRCNANDTTQAWRTADPVATKPQILQKCKEKTLYISDSMFRNLDIAKLSSESQTAVKFFYPGANATQMMYKLKHDPKFAALEKDEITKVFVLTGTNNIDDIYYDRNGGSLNRTVTDIRNLIYFLKSTLNAAVINVLNILPRKNAGRCDIINIINSHLKSVCEEVGCRLSYVDTFDNKMFSHRDGKRREEFFNPYSRFGEDDAHLNPIGVVRLGKFLKFVSHNY